MNIDIYDIVDRLLEVRNCKPGKEVLLTEEEIDNLIELNKDIHLKQPNLLELSAPIKICGDIHGQYYDLIRIFEYGGFPPESNYLFLGDYVDRGRQGIETLCLLMAYKILFPENFFILRGNHECSTINKLYGFYEECKRRYSIKLWKSFVDFYNYLPICAIIENRIICMHGGLSPDLKELNQINQIYRPLEVPDKGLVCDILWSDPNKVSLGWGYNERGISYVFGKDVINHFLKKNDLDLIVRAHQVVEDGYEFFNNKKLVTIFSASNYCGEFDNSAVILSVDENLICSFNILKPLNDRNFIKK